MYIYICVYIYIYIYIYINIYIYIHIYIYIYYHMYTSFGFNCYVTQRNIKMFYLFNNLNLLI